MKAVLTDHQHNLFHWLTVIFLKLVRSFFLIPLSFYLFAFGFVLSRNNLQSHLSPNLLEKISFYSGKLPLFPLISGSTFDLLNHWYQEATTWWALVIGLPMMIVGLSIFIMSLSALVQSIFSNEYNRTNCPFCKRPVRIKKNHAYLD